MDMRPDDPVEKIATSPAITVDGDVTLREAAQVLATANVGVLVALPHGARPMSILSERDVIRALADGADPDEVWVADVMTEDPRYATPGQSVRSAAEEMLAAGVRHLPVVEDGEVVGMVAVRDAVRILTGISRRREGRSSLLRATAVERELAHPGG